MNGNPPLLLVTEADNSTPDEFFHSFFEGHEDDLAGCGPVQAYPPCTEIFREDAPAEVVYLIERGLVKLSHAEPDGRHTVVAVRGRHWLLAAPQVFLGIPYRCTGTTVTQCLLRPVTVKCFLHLLGTNETFSWEVHRLFSQEILRNLRKVVEVTRMSASERLRYFLHQLMSEMTTDESKIKDHFEVPLKHRELAAIIGVSPEHLCRIIKKMEQEGVLKSTKGMLTIMDASRLLTC